MQYFCCNSKTIYYCSLQAQFESAFLLLCQFANWRVITELEWYFLCIIYTIFNVNQKWNVCKPALEYNFDFIRNQQKHTIPSRTSSEHKFFPNLYVTANANLQTQWSLKNYASCHFKPVIVCYVTSKRVKQISGKYAYCTLYFFYELIDKQRKTMQL